MLKYRKICYGHTLEFNEDVDDGNKDGLTG